MKTGYLTSWVKGGTPWIWISAGAVSTSLIMVFGLLALIAFRGLGFYWPADLLEIDYKTPKGEVITLVGEVQETEVVPAEQLRSNGVHLPKELTQVKRLLLKIANRESNGLDFLWVNEHDIQAKRYPVNLVSIERREWGNAFGYLKSIKEKGTTIAEGDSTYAEFSMRLDRALLIFNKIQHLEKDKMGSINYQLERLRLHQRKLELSNDLSPAEIEEIKTKKQTLDNQYLTLQQQLSQLYQQIDRDSVTITLADGSTTETQLAQVVRFYQPNHMNIIQKSWFYVHKLWEFLSDEPREANTEGGIFPAIFGTVIMVIIMTIMVTPFGVVAAVYLREYANQGFITRIIRIAVNNLAGVPSIVYGIFGLGFFVYFLGGNIDQLFFPEALPAPTYGTPGLLWSSLTLALLTLPVVIVATEEGLSRVPRAVREGSLALGATKAETLWRIVLPMASPALMTGLILAVARAAGEVAPLMLVGVVKMAPTLPLDGDFPFIHLERKFMHLGFHIYDVGFQSPNIEAARPLVYATAFLLVLVIVGLNLSAMAIRNRLREKYSALEH